MLRLAGPGPGTQLLRSEIHMLSWQQSSEVPRQREPTPKRVHKSDLRYSFENTLRRIVEAIRIFQNNLAVTMQFLNVFCFLNILKSQENANY